MAILQKMAIVILGEAPSLATKKNRQIQASPSAYEGESDSHSSVSRRAYSLQQPSVQAASIILHCIAAFQNPDGSTIDCQAQAQVDKKQDRQMKIERKMDGVGKACTSLELFLCSMLHPTKAWLEHRNAQEYCGSCIRNAIKGG